MSSSRVHCTLTGAFQPIALAVLTASSITSASGVARRPKLPPAIITCSRTRSSGSSAIRAATAW